MKRLGAVLALLAAGGCATESDELVLVGTVERTLIELVAPVSEVITGIHAERGEGVEPAQPLVQLDTTLAVAEVRRAEASLAAARTGEAVAGQELSRIERLHGGRVASEQELDRARLGRDEATARLREARALLAVANKRLRDLTLASPVHGVVDQLPFDRGERVPAGGVVAVVLDDAEPWVRVWIPEPDFARIGPGLPARVEIDGLDGALRGRVLDVAREPQFTPHYALTERDRAHLVYEARVRILDAPPSLRPGVPAAVTLETQADGAGAL